MGSNTSEGPVGSVAWLFGGQGCEVPQMGLHLPSQALDPLLDVASECIGADARSLLARGGPRWARTEVVQPLLVAVGLATASLLGVPMLCAGHSLGAFTAWAAAGGCSAPDAVRLAGVRARAMVGVPGGMVVVRNGDEAPENLTLAVVNPGEHVYAGAEPDVLRAVAAGATRVPVAGPWHTAAMRPAAEALAAGMRELPEREAPAWVGSAGRSNPRGQLVDELGSTYRWDLVLAQLGGARHVVLVGPARPLVAHVRRALPQAVIWRTDDAAELDRTRTGLEACHAA